MRDHRSRPSFLEDQRPAPPLPLPDARRPWTREERLLALVVVGLGAVSVTLAALCRAL